MSINLQTYIYRSIGINPDIIVIRYKGSVCPMIFRYRHPPCTKPTWSCWFNVFHIWSFSFCFAIYRLKKSIKAAHEKIHGSLFYPKKVDFLIASIKIKNEWTFYPRKVLCPLNLSMRSGLLYHDLYLSTTKIKGDCAVCLTK